MLAALQSEIHKKKVLPGINSFAKTNLDRFDIGESIMTPDK
jgi:hypothetical protein